MIIGNHKRRRRRRERSPLATLALAGGAIAALAVIVWVAVTAGSGLPTERHYTLEASFRDLAGLTAHNEVRISGRRVGQVLDPRFEDGMAVVDLQLDRDVAPLRSDTRARVRSKGLLGQRFLELEPGGSGRELGDEERIPRVRTAATISLPTAISELDRSGRAALRSTLRGLGRGLWGQGEQVNSTLRLTPSLLRDAIAVSDAVLERPGAAARLAPSLRSGVGAVEAARDELAGSLAPASRALRPLVERREEVRDVLQQAPPAFAALRSGLARTDPLLVEAERLSVAANEMLRPAADALAETRALLADSPAALSRTAALMRQMRATTPVALRLADRALPQLRGIDRTLETGLPLLDELGPHGCDVVGWARNWRSMLGSGVSGGGRVGPLNVLRLELIGSPESVGGLRQPVNAEAIGRNPYPRPCEAGTEQLP